MRWTRRLAIPLLAAAAAAGCSVLYRTIGGDFAGEPHELWPALSPAGRELVAAAFRGLPQEQPVDFHVHIVGLGTSGSGAAVHPSWRSSWDPIQRGRTRVYLSAAGIEDLADADREYVERLERLAADFPGGGRFHLLAMDRHYRPDGAPDSERTPFYVPNEYVVALARRRPDVFVPVVSVHPHRHDAVEEIERWAALGVRYLKWLPNAMGIDPSAPQLDPFYDRLRDLGVVLCSHTGRERAVEAEDSQELGSPLLLRRPLARGVRVIALHSASDGEDEDLDSPRRERVSSFRLFLRLMDEPRYDGLLYGELSAVAFFNHLGEALETLLEREDLHPRLVNGSDYPLPGINILTRTTELVRRGFITADERRALNEVYQYNPLLFDFLVKRTVKHPRTGKRFPAAVFGLAAGLPDGRIRS